MAAACLVAALFAISCELINPGNGNNQEPDETEFFDLSDSENSGTTIVEFDASEGKMVASFPSDMLPKKGDILISGITETAPYGFAVEVESVVTTKASFSDGVYAVINFVGADINKVLRKYLGEGVSRFGISQQDFAEHSDESFIMPTFKDGSFGFKNSYKVKNDEKTLDLTIDVGKKININQFEIIIDTSSPHLKLGYEMAVLNTDLIHVKGKATMVQMKGDFWSSLRKKYPLPENPWFIIPIPETPIVITTQISPNLPWVVSLSTSIDCDILKRKYIFHSGFMFDTETSEFSLLDGHDQVSFTEYLDERAESINMETSREVELSLNGDASIGLDGSFTIGLWGSNLLTQIKSPNKYWELLSTTFNMIMDMFEDANDDDTTYEIELERYFKEKYGEDWAASDAPSEAGSSVSPSPAILAQSDNNEKPEWKLGQRGPSFGFDFTAIPLFHKGKLGIKTAISDEYGNATTWVDELKMGAKFSLKPWFSVWKLMVGRHEWDFKLVERDEYKWEPKIPVRSSLFSAYDKLKAKLTFSYTENIPVIRVTSKKYRPLWGYVGAFQEMDCGFCLESSTSHEQHLYTMPSSLFNSNGDVEVDIPTADLKDGVKYKIYPYNRVKTLGGSSQMIYREGIFITFKDGQLTCSTIEDIEGELL